MSQTPNNNEINKIIQNFINGQIILVVWVFVL